MQTKKKEPEKYCKNCADRLTRKTYNGRLEDFGVFLRRKFCNLNCAWMCGLKESVTLSGLYKRATKLKAKTCRKCGSRKLLGIHHKDRNPANNSKENLITLCASCHTKLHWKEGKSPWKGRAKCVICGNGARTHGLCQKHWFRLLKYGNPHLTRRVGRAGPILKLPALEQIEPTN